MNRIHLIYLVMFLISCGTKHKVPSVFDKQIIFDLETEDKLLRDSINNLVARYNQDIGNEYLIVDAERANSYIEFEKGLHKNSESGAVANGIWESHRVVVENDAIISKSYHEVFLKFDLDYFKFKVESQDFNFLYRLFCHEVGHGIKFDHDPNPDSVMYYQIPNDNSHVDNEGYFERALEYFNPKSDLIIVEKNEND